MHSTQIDLSDEEEARLGALADLTGRRRDELIRFAIRRLLAEADERAAVNAAKAGDGSDPQSERPTWGIWGHIRGLPEDFHDWRAAEEEERFKRLYPDQA